MPDEVPLLLERLKLGSASIIRLGRGSANNQPMPERIDQSPIIQVSLRQVSFGKEEET